MLVRRGPERYILHEQEGDHGSASRSIPGSSKATREGRDNEVCDKHNSTLDETNVSNAVLQSRRPGYLGISYRGQEQRPTSELVDREGCQSSPYQVPDLQTCRNESLVCDRGYSNSSLDLVSASGKATREISIDNPPERQSGNRIRFRHPTTERKPQGIL